MKKILFSLIAAASINASAEYVTVEVCDQSGDPAYTTCKTVTYKVRPESPAQPAGPEMCPGYSEPVPCPTEYGVPGWLQDLNQWFIDHGAQPPAGGVDHGANLG